MENENAIAEQPKSGGYKVGNVILIDSKFTRNVSIDLSKCEIETDVKIEPSFQETTSENKFAVTLTLFFTGKFEGNIVCDSTIKMLGLFEKVGEPALPEDAFKQINAPAIIYPFIREHLHNICLKGGIANVLLPTVNFKP